MWTFMSKQHVLRSLAFGALSLLAAGCSEEKIAPTTYPGASREMMENPVLYAAKIKALKEGKDVNSVTVEPSKPLTAKQKKTIENAKANPADARDAAQAKQ